MRYLICFSIAAILLFTHRSSAQDIQHTNDSLFALVKADINAQKSDDLYALLNDDFKAKLPKDAFVAVLTGNLYPMGPIKEHSLIGFTDGTSAYKATMKDAILEFRLSADKNGKISGLRFLPYKEPSATKTATVPTNNPMQTAQDRQVDTKARLYINKLNTTGLSIGVVKNGVASIYGYGETQRGNGKIPGPYAIFEIGSVTKTFTATLLAYYVVTHKVSLSDPVAKYLPDSVAANKELQAVTLQMLSNHTSGLPRVPDNMLTGDIDMMNPYKAYDDNKLFSYLKGCRLHTPAGKDYAYSNLAAGLLGVILERVSGKTYEQMIEEVICRPLGMSNTLQHPDADQQKEQVSVYNEKGEPVIMWDMAALAGAGAIRSTTQDMIKYVQANMIEDGTPLSKAIDLTHKVTMSEIMKVGLGWHISDINGQTYYWHNGGTGGSRSFVAFMPDKHIGVVILSNAAEDADEVGKGILRILQ